MRLFPTLIGLLLLPFMGAAAATVEVRFVESAPKDRFVVINAGSCELVDLVLEVDLRSTKGQLIFDTTASGAGVEVFQPFEQLEGKVALSSAASVKDGDKSLTVKISSIPVQGQVSFTIDVDDTLTNSELGQIRVSGSEMQGGKIKITMEGAEPVQVAFNGNNTAILDHVNCP